MRRGGFGCILRNSRIVSYVGSIRFRPEGHKRPPYYTLIRCVRVRTLISEAFTAVARVKLLSGPIVFFRRGAGVRTRFPSADRQVRRSGANPARGDGAGSTQDGSSERLLEGGADERT